MLVKKPVNQGRVQKAGAVVVALDELPTLFRRQMEIPSREETDFAARRARDLRRRCGDELAPSGTGGDPVEKPNEFVDLNERRVAESVARGERRRSPAGPRVDPLR